MQVKYTEFTVIQALSCIRGVKIEEGKENVWGEKIRRNEWEEEEDKEEVRVPGFLYPIFY